MRLLNLHVIVFLWCDLPYPLPVSLRSHYLVTIASHGDIQQLKEECPILIPNVSNCLPCVLALFNMWGFFSSFLSDLPAVWVGLWYDVQGVWRSSRSRIWTLAMETYSVTIYCSCYDDVQSVLLCRLNLIPRPIPSLHVGLTQSPFPFPDDAQV